MRLRPSGYCWYMTTSLGLQRVEGYERTGSSLYGNEEVVVVGTGNNVATDADVGKSRGHCSGKTNSIEVGGDGEGDPGAAGEDGQASLLGFSFGQDERHPLRFTYTGNDGGWRDGCARRNAGEDEDARLHLGF